VLARKKLWIKGDNFMPDEFKRKIEDKFLHVLVDHVKAQAKENRSRVRS